MHTWGKHTALHIAVEANEKEIVEYLIRKGANPDLKNDVSDQLLDTLFQKELFALKFIVTFTDTGKEISLIINTDIISVLPICRRI